MAEDCLNRAMALQQSANWLPVKAVKHKKGTEMPADFLSHNIIDAVELSAVHNTMETFPSLKLTFPQLVIAQQQYPPYKDLKTLLLKQTLSPPPYDLEHQSINQFQQYRQQLISLAKQCFIERDNLWRHTSEGERPIIQLLVPPSLWPQIL